MSSESKEERKIKGKKKGTKNSPYSVLVNRLRHAPESHGGSSLLDADEFSIPDTGRWVEAKHGAE